MGIDMSLLAGLPGLVALVLCLKKGPGYAFLNVYLPVLLLLPDECRMPLSGQLNCSESAIIPIALIYLWEEGRNWQWSFTDLLVFALAALVSISEYENTNYWLAQHLALRMMTGTVLPYLVAKGLIVQEDLGVEIAKRIVMLTAIVAIVSVYELRMTRNPFVAFLSPIFPAIDQVPSFRYGVARIRGPWNHPILAGVILAVAYRAARWLEWTDSWPGKVPFLPMSKVRFCEIAVVIGSLMTISRGPWIGAFVAAAIMMLVRARQRTFFTVLAVLATLIVAIPMYSAFDSYVTPSRYERTNEERQSAAYRAEMLKEYVTIAEQRPDWGWGSTETGKGLFPTIEGMGSIDNHFLLLALYSGMYALSALVLIFLWMPARLLGFSLRHGRDDPKTSLAVTFLGVFILFAISIFTAWMGAQTEPLFFLFLGWSEALQVLQPAPEASVVYQFERVMV